MNYRDHKDKRDHRTLPPSVSSIFPVPVDAKCEERDGPRRKDGRKSFGVSESNVTKSTNRTRKTPAVSGYQRKFKSVEVHTGQVKDAGLDGMESPVFIPPEMDSVNHRDSASQSTAGTDNAMKDGIPTTRSSTKRSSRKIAHAQPSSSKSMTSNNPGKNSQRLSGTKKSTSGKGHKSKTG